MDAEARKIAEKLVSRMPKLSKNDRNALVQSLIDGFGILEITEIVQPSSYDDDNTMSDSILFVALGTVALYCSPGDEYPYGGVSDGEVSLTRIVC